MTDDQEFVTEIYGWTAFGFLSAYIAVLLFMQVYGFFNYFNGQYDVSLVQDCPATSSNPR